MPSVAIKEGVYKSLQITEEHFKGIYANIQYDFLFMIPKNSGKYEVLLPMITSK